MEGYQAEDSDTGSSVEESSGSISDGYSSDLESMTGKGIKRLCSELLELKKSSDEDFQRSVCSNSSVFVRVFEEVGGVESEFMTLKRHLLTQRKLVQDLTSYLCLDIIFEDPKFTIAEETDDIDSPNMFGAHRYSILETLDVLLLEHRTEEALIILEAEAKNLKKLQLKGGHLSTNIALYMSGISDRKTRLVDQFSSLAEHPRVTHPELHKAISGLCRLGENNRATLLLLNFYHFRVEGCFHGFECSIPSQQGPYVRELAKSVFSAISQAARSFVMLYGETETSLASEFIQWAREEIESFSRSFDKYVKAISVIDGSLYLAVDAATSSLSFCALLKSQKIVLQPYLAKLIRPCMEEALHLHMDHFKKVISIFSATDTWVLNKFLISDLRTKSHLHAIGSEVELCMLTSGGSKFITLIQEIVDDITPLVILQMEDSILKGIIELFYEYFRTLEKAIPHGGITVEADSLRTCSSQKLQRQLSLLVNSLEIVQLFSSITSNIVEGFSPSNNNLFLEDTKVVPQNEHGSWMSPIQEAADRLRSCLCERLVNEIMSGGESYSITSPESEDDGQRHIITSSSDGPMPSLAFQAFFLMLRQLKPFLLRFAVKDGIVKKLLEELMETMFIYLSCNHNLWKRTGSRSFILQCSCFVQVHIDIYFLLEITKIGGYFSNRLMVAALDLIDHIGVILDTYESGSNSVMPDDGWVLNAAKLAVQKLLDIDVSESDTKAATTIEEELISRQLEFVSLYGDSSEECKDSVGSKSEELLEEDTGESLEEDSTELIKIENIQTESLRGSFSSGHLSNDDSRSPTVPFASMGNGHHEIREDMDTYTAESLEEDWTELFKIKNIETESLQGSFSSIHLSDDSRCPTIPFVSMGGGHDEIQADMIEGMEELDVEVEPVDSSITPEPLETIDTEIPAAELDSFEDSNKLDSPVAGSRQLEGVNNLIELIDTEIDANTSSSLLERVGLYINKEEPMIPQTEDMGEDSDEKCETDDHRIPVQDLFRDEETTRPKGGRKRPKGSSAAESPLMNNKGPRVARPRWH